jgi:hypothetical protein
MRLLRLPWGKFPLLHSYVPSEKLLSHHLYPKAAAGDFTSAEIIVDSFSYPSRYPFNPEFIAPLIIADSGGKFDALPLAYAILLAKKLKARVCPHFVSEKITPQSGSFHDHFFSQRPFSGHVLQSSYLIVASHVIFGSAIANLRSHIVSQGGSVPGVCSLSCDLFAPQLSPTPSAVVMFNRKHASDLPLFVSELGFPPDCLTNRELYNLYGFKSLKSFFSAGRPH